MPDGYKLDPATLEQVTGALRKAGTSLEDMDGGPGRPDAGELSDVIGAMMTKLVDDTLELAAGLNAAGDQVNNARNIYLVTENNHRRTFDSQ
ncbi:hypothetical protein KIPE111705_46560 [Kibdelosporangium persicum]|uniref:Excreted virulence factor EspC, type VII ESX diderm n=1 Tax=Kibdelosporangium persicum TaxID=2698649 RepID=A0ABX2FJ75_9PSEU|nr:hypothetical protein [Kibdelosporangium persicum]NRN71442.1 hypothetical protein [Kibdelosporangium persicum]